MTRPKVDPDKRQRTAQACDSCKRRKQKCNGLKPCHTCAKRTLTCTYGASEEGADDVQGSPKRRMIASPSKRHETHESQEPQWVTPTGSRRPSLGGLQEVDVANMKAVAHTISLLANGNGGNGIGNANGPYNEKRAIEDGTTNEKDKATSNSQEEEAIVYSNTRMLQDPTGRLLYIGDSATLSFLQLIRMIVENVAGPSAFTLDPRRHKIVENAFSLPQNIRRTHLLPDKKTADVLVGSYFTNINGLVEVCNRKSFLMTLETCYTDPLGVDPSWLCQLYLVFAIGLVMAAPMPGSPEESVIQKLRAEEVDRAEIFYSDAKQLADPSTGFEDAGFWSIQALTLMSIYMLAVSKRNAAYAYYGMAVRSAFALGLHREETMCIFSSAEQSVRRNLWRSLFVLDRFLAASLGRPTAIRESDCSGTTLRPEGKVQFPQSSLSRATNASQLDSSELSLEASVRSCHVIGVILEKVYSNRRISTKLAQEIADDCKGWPRLLNPALHHRKATPTSPSDSIAILHVNLLYCHSVLLLTRPFFLYLMNKIHQSRGQKSEKHSIRMVKFAETCVHASTTTVALVQAALEGQYLPHRNPFVLYFLFTAALVVLSNEFSALCHNPTAGTTIDNAINIMHYFAQRDPQGDRLLFILTSYREVVIRQQASRPPKSIDLQSPSFMHHPSVPLTDDPMVNMFHGQFPTNGISSPPIESIANSRRSSVPNMASPPILNRLQSHTSDSAAIRPGPLDHFYNLSQVASHGSNDGDSMGENAEIDFDNLWKWPANGTGLAQGAGVGVIGGIHPPLNVAMDMRSMNDNSVPLFGITSADFGTS